MAMKRTYSKLIDLSDAREDEGERVLERDGLGKFTEYCRDEDVEMITKMMFDLVLSV